jgi:hypothetical protein
LKQINSRDRWRRLNRLWKSLTRRFKSWKFSIKNSKAQARAHQKSRPNQVKKIEIVIKRQRTYHQKDNVNNLKVKMSNSKNGIVKTKWVRKNMSKYNNKVAWSIKKAILFPKKYLHKGRKHKQNKKQLKQKYP